MNESTCACEKLEGKIPSYSHNLQTFGEIAIVKDNGLKIKGKLKDRGMKAMFVGYADNHTGHVYRFMNLKTKKFHLSQDITWMNKLYGDIYRQKNVGERYNLKDNTSEDKFIEIETEGETQKPRSIPREVRNLQTSYNDAEAIFQDVIDEHEYCEFGGLP